jgi:hypothetical protein
VAADLDRLFGVDRTRLDVDDPQDRRFLDNATAVITGTATKAGTYPSTIHDDLRSPKTTDVVIQPFTLTVSARS